MVVVRDDGELSERERRSCRSYKGATHRLHRQGTDLHCAPQAREQESGLWSVSGLTFFFLMSGTYPRACPWTARHVKWRCEPSHLSHMWCSPRWFCLLHHWRRQALRDRRHLERQARGRGGCGFGHISGSRWHRLGSLQESKR